MSATQITVENRTDIRIYALLTWAEGHIGGVYIEPRPGGEGSGPSGKIPCEWVYYDLSIIEPGTEVRDAVVGGVVGGHKFAEWTRVRGGDSYIFQRSGEVYRLDKHP
jgi:hypothetical protein